MEKVHLYKFWKEWSLVAVMWAVWKEITESYGTKRII